MFFELEDRCYRAPDDNLAAMEILSAEGQWSRYLGDIALVLAMGTQVESCTTDLTSDASRKAWDVRGRGHAERPDAEKAARVAAAKKTHKPSNRKKQRWAKANETVVADMVSGANTDDNAPTDVNVSLANVLHAIEVKTLLDNSNSKITMHPKSRRRKIAWARKNGASLHTVVIDDRDKFSPASKTWSGHRVYYAAGVGSFNVPGHLTLVRNAAHLRQLLGLTS